MSEPLSARGPAGIAVGLGLVGFIVGGGVLDNLPYFADAREALRGQAGPGGMPDDGDVGRAVARALDTFGARAPFGRRPEEFPSTIVLDADQIRDELPVLSIVADDDHLHDPANGILANILETGPEWERLAWATLWEAGEFVVGSRVGLRIHGDSTRYIGLPSFRLHFRPMYGASRLHGGRLIGPDADPASAVVVHVVRYKGHYPNIFVFEIARRLGLPTVDFRPARVFLNGEDRGIYVLTERVMPDGWGLTHFGSPDFFMYVYKGETKPRSQEAHTELADWVSELSPLTMFEAATRIDVENLTRHLFTVMFTFSTDWAQGAALLDGDDAAARWFWLHWDMDQSFDIRGIVDLEPWQQPVMELVTLDVDLDRLKLLGIVTDARHTERHMGDLRRVVFTELLTDPAYRRYFARFVSDALNHELTESFFTSMLGNYEYLARSPGVFSRVDLGDYLRRRPDFVRAEVARYLDLRPPVTIRVEAPEGVSLIIDGYAEATVYTGSYFPGQTLTVEVAEVATGQFSHWLVDGERVDGARLELPIETPGVIQAISLNR